MIEELIEYQALFGDHRLSCFAHSEEEAQQILKRQFLDYVKSDDMKPFIIWTEKAHSIRKSGD